jgi:gliding motility-associated-like protein
LNEPALNLPTTSTNGITGSWSPATINTSVAGTSTYTFTPNSGQCALNTTMNVIISDGIVPTFNPLANVCQNAPAPSFPLTSNNGISGTWSPAVSTATLGTTSYTFTPNPGSCAVNGTLTLTVNDIITPTFNPITSVCQGAPAPVLPTVSTNGVSGTWSGTVSTATAGTFPFTFTPTNATCTNTAQLTVTINPLPIANAGADQAVCQGQQVTLNGTGGISQTWTSGVQNGVPFAPPVTSVFTLTVTDANNCQSSDQVTVTVNPSSIISGGPNQTVCEGTQITLSGSGGTAYTWTNGVVNGVPFTPPVGTTTYGVTDNNPTGCSGTSQVTVTVHPNPIVNAGTDVLICEGASTTLTATGATSYQWDNNVINGVPFSPSAPTTYTVVGVSQQGCFGTDQVFVDITPTPIPSLTPDVTLACVPGTITFTNTTNAPQNTFSWNIGSSSNQTGQGPIVHTYNNVGCYDIILTSTTPNGCVGTTTYPNLVCIVENPVAEFTYSPTSLDLINSTTQFINDSQGAVSYVWSFGDESGTSTQFEPEHEFPGLEPGSYVVTLLAINQYGCTDTTYQIVRVEDALIYYIPNTFTPDGDEFNQVFKPIFTSGFDPFNYNLKIYNRWGELIFESNDKDYGWNGSYGNVRELCPQGVYVYTIEFKLSKNDARKKIDGHVLLMK